MTGTPIQNRVEDLYSLLLFLRVDPFDQLNAFNYHIGSPLKAGKDIGTKKLRLLVKSIALRRTKSSVSDQLQLAPRIDQTELVDLTAEESKIYSLSKRSALEVVQHSVTSGGKIKTFSGILSSIVALRQICNHGTGLLSQTAVDRLKQCDSGQSCRSPASYLASCEICEEEVQDYEPTSSTLQMCLHVLCKKCLSAGEEEVSVRSTMCPLCAGSATGAEGRQSAPGRSPVAERQYRPSSKVVALLHTLRSYSAERSLKPIKRYFSVCRSTFPQLTASYSVVFSCWTKMLGLIGRALTIEGIYFERIDGQKSDAQRRRAVEIFRTNPDCTVLLASIGSAGVG